MLGAEQETKVCSPSSCGDIVNDEISHKSSLSQGSTSDPPYDKGNSAVCSMILCS
jgi:hypothetical protein